MIYALIVLALVLFVGTVMAIGAAYDSERQFSLKTMFLIVTLAAAALGAGAIIYRISYIAPLP